MISRGLLRDLRVLCDFEWGKVLGPEPLWEDSYDGLCNQQRFQKGIHLFKSQGLQNMILQVHGSLKIPVSGGSPGNPTHIVPAFCYLDLSKPFHISFKLHAIDLQTTDKKTKTNENLQPIPF